MKVDVVVDVGNTRIKWGRCGPEGVWQMIPLPLDRTAWENELSNWWDATQPLFWAISGVHPDRCAMFLEWIWSRGERVWVANHFRQLPIDVALPCPEQIGIDRLLNAVAAHRRLDGRRSAIVVDAGSAVTVDWVDAEGVFRGGAIMPGLGLMGKSLHDYTALLPLVEVSGSSPNMPGQSTQEAIEAGLYYGVTGGINTLIDILRQRMATDPHLFLTGGDAIMLQSGITKPAEVWPEMTLEGLRIAADAGPV